MPLEAQHFGISSPTPLRMVLDASSADSYIAVASGHVLAETVTLSSAGLRAGAAANRALNPVTWLLKGTPTARLTSRGLATRPDMQMASPSVTGP